MIVSSFLPPPLKSSSKLFSVLAGVLTRSARVLTVLVVTGTVASVRAQVTYYLDPNPYGPGFGANSLFVLWSTSIADYWSSDPSGNAVTSNWSNVAPPSNAVLGNGTGTAAYTAVLNEDISVGSILTVNGTWTVSLGTYSLTLDSPTNSTLGVTITGTGSIIKNGIGTVTLASVNNFSGGTTISGGTLAFANANTNVGPVMVNSGGTLQYANSAALPSATALSLAGGTLALSAAYSPNFSTPLSLLASSTINFGSGLGASTITFGDSSAQSWTGSLTISNYDLASDALRFGSTSGSLTGAQLSAINFDGFAAQIDSNGFVTPVPEPATYAVILSFGALMFAAFRRRQISFDRADTG